MIALVALALWMYGMLSIACSLLHHLAIAGLHQTSIRMADIEVSGLDFGTGQSYTLVVWTSMAAVGVKNVGTGTQYWSTIMY